MAYICELRFELYCTNTIQHTKINTSTSSVVAGIGKNRVTLLHDCCSFITTGIMYVNVLHILSFLQFFTIDSTKPCYGKLFALFFVVTVRTE